VKEKDFEAHVPAAQSAAETNPRVLDPDEHQERPESSGPAARQGAQTPDGVNGGSFRFGKEDRLRKRKEFDTVFRKGFRYRARYVEFVWKINRLERSRLGLVVSRKTGNAVTRNRVKRLLREVFRRNRHRFPFSIDLIVRAYPKKEIPSGYAEAENEYRNFVNALSA
jgi:ribonuclease P protein component